MSQIPTPELEAPVGHARIVYLGPVSPHWDVQSDFGDRALIDDFRARVRPGSSWTPRTTRSSGATESGFRPRRRAGAACSSIGTSASPKTEA